MLTPSPQMDWIGDKLALLIEQGKKALSREIVVMSDAAEDEVDDASGAWEEQHPAHDRGFVRVHALETPPTTGRAPCRDPHLRLPADAHALAHALGGVRR